MQLGYGYSFNIVRKLNSISPEAQAVIDRMTGLSSTENDATIVYVDAMVASGNYALIDEIGCFCLGSTNGVIGFKTASGTAIGSPTFSVNGVSLNGTNQYIILGFNPSTDGVNYILDDAMYGAYLYEETNIIDNEAILGNAFLFDAQPSNNRHRYRVNSLTTTSAASADVVNQQLLQASRTSSSAVQFYTDGVSDGGASQTSTSVASASLWFGRKASDYSQIIGSLWVIGASVGFDYSTFNTNTNTFLTSLGAIP